MFFSMFFENSPFHWPWEIKSVTMADFLFIIALTTLRSYDYFYLIIQDSPDASVSQGEHLVWVIMGFKGDYGASAKLVFLLLSFFYLYS